ncbi:Phosphoglucomutase-1 [Sarcoptes scabiei]|uniref:phosphoglucomutase (alpha-D-glucose-1,6-bisphosphate-dependent) n=1 Tax=Sarcoptes scabiei TaxID=52283 RepID=A0A834VJG4_SARSC|nr:Phosphoglucomutase-1 [Sarcoptes scabiei]
MARIVEKQTKPFQDQKPGTSGLRKPVDIFKKANYLENFIQSLLNVSLIDVANPNAITLVIGGDGRYYSKNAIKTIISICAANQIGHLIIAHNGIMSTPAISAVIRTRQIHGAIILTASHNPGGPQGDFGVKFNCSNGGPAPETFTNLVFQETLSINSYKILENDLSYDLTRIGMQKFEISDRHEISIEVIDSVAIYLQLLKSIFDFESLRSFVSSKKLLFDGMSGVMGPYIRKIIIDELGASTETAVRSIPLEDFGGHHPDPNLTYAADLVETMRNGNFDFGAAFDGDGDRNMILGAKGFFVTPSDSLAVLADNLNQIPYFANKIKGFARSMPTSRAIDKVAQNHSLKCYETPTGWKFFGSLMDADLVSLCGEESFGTGSDHIREKDGLWAALAWLSIMNKLNQSVEDIVKNHWRKYGRHFYCRYDYEQCDLQSSNEMMSSLRAKILNKQIPTEIEAMNRVYRLSDAFDFEYIDPITSEHVINQGLVLLFNEASSRIIFRLSGTGSSGATVRLYIENYESDPEKACTSLLQDQINPLAEVALQISSLPKFIGRTEPTVIT